MIARSQPECVDKKIKPHIQTREGDDTASKDASYEKSQLRIVNQPKQITRSTLCLEAMSEHKRRQKRKGEEERKEKERFYNQGSEMSSDCVALRCNWPWMFEKPQGYCLRTCWTVEKRRKRRHPQPDSLIATSKLAQWSAQANLKYVVTTKLSWLRKVAFLRTPTMVRLSKSFGSMS